MLTLTPRTPPSSPPDRMTVSAPTPAPAPAPATATAASVTLGQGLNGESRTDDDAITASNPRHMSQGDVRNNAVTVVVNGESIQPVNFADTDKFADVVEKAVAAKKAAPATSAASSSANVDNGDKDIESHATGYVRSKPYVATHRMCVCVCVSSEAL